LIRKAGKGSDILLAAELGSAAVIEMARSGQMVDSLALELSEAVEETVVKQAIVKPRAVNAARPMPVVVVSRKKKRNNVIALPQRYVAVAAQK
jgi:hypothetical protein